MGGKVIAEGGGLVGETVTRQLHTVTGVAREADDDPFQFLDRQFLSGAAVSGRLRHGVVLL
ncbi:hypothetical protein NSK11_contig00269-0001 [Nocardia seriolae]|uniref:Uncharacterized protein n=1 Tax=Nocardia seriolae TaxID=37332 RepID=A0ABC9Z738_9NOCA|nr:hypothetical protein NS07_v2contig00267-0001 [Nocardia seriolae]GAP33442.1 hypothetical protein NSK11_contig00269-0001 [Nocardia seriolae]